MDSNEIYEIAWQRDIRKENRESNEFERVILRTGGEAQCFYCNFNLECGQQKCIWGDDRALPSA